MSDSATPWIAAHQSPLSIAISRTCSNSCPLSQWCYLTISSSATPFSFFLQSFPASGSFRSKSLQTFRLCGRRWGWDVLREQHWNKCTIKGETDCQSRLDAWDTGSGLVHWEDPEGWDGEGGGRGDRDGEHM